MRGISKTDVGRLLKRIEALRDEPRPSSCEKLAAKELDRIRQGVYRVVYSVDTAYALLALVTADRDLITSLGRATGSALLVHQALQRQPLATAAALVKQTGLTAATVNKSLSHLRELDIVTELTQRRRGRVFGYQRYVELLNAELE